MRFEDTDVVIVGAGVAGLAMAVEAFRRGLGARVLDRGGGGLPERHGALYQPGALACLARLGTYDAVRSAGSAADRIALHRGGDAEPAAVLGLAGLDTELPLAVGVSHAAFERIALDTYARYQAIRMDYRTELLSLYRERGRVAGAVARGPEGEVTYRARVVVVTTGSGGAPIRAEAGAATRTRPTGNEHLALAAGRPDGFPDALSVWLGPRLMVAAYPLSRDAVQIEAVAPAGRLGEARRAGPDALRRLLGAAAPPLEPALDRLDPDDAAPVQPIVRSRVATWTADGVALTGPAAHGFSPCGFNAETQSVLDAATLARVLSRSQFTGDFSQLALRPYETERRPRVEAVAALSLDLERAGTAPAGLHAQARRAGLERLAAAPGLARRVLEVLAGLGAPPLRLAERLRLAGILPLGAAAAGAGSGAGSGG